MRRVSFRTCSSAAQLPSSTSSTHASRIGAHVQAASDGTERATDKQLAAVDHVEQICSNDLDADHAACRVEACEQKYVARAEERRQVRLREHSEVRNLQQQIAARFHSPWIGGTSAVGNINMFFTTLDAFSWSPRAWSRSARTTHTPVSPHCSEIRVRSHIA